MSEQFKTIDVFAAAGVSGRFVNDVLSARDMLAPILSGEIERGHCSPGQREAYGGVPGKRRVTLADARRLVKHVTAALNAAVERFVKLSEEIGL